MNAIRWFGAFVGMILFMHSATWAQPYPVKPVRVVVVFPPGGATDVVARFVFQKMAEQLNQQCPIDNRAGAGGTIGADIVAKSPPDGYTIMVYSQTLVANAHLYQKLPYDSIKDFIGITPVTRLINMLAVHPQLPARTTQDFINLAKARPGEMLYGSAGVGASQHLSMSLFANVAGAKMTHVPFKGGAPAVLAMIGGEIHSILTPVAEVYPYLKSGRLRPLAVSTPQRTTQFPEIPAIAETLKGFEFVGWFGAFVPAGTPRPIVDKLNAELKKAVADTDVAAKLSAQVLDPMYSTPEEFAKLLRSDYEKYREIVKLSGARID